MMLSRSLKTLSLGAAALVIAAALPARAQDAAELILRIDRLEALVRQLNGQVEQANNQNRRLEEQVKRFQNDTDFRFKELEGGRGGARPQPAPTPGAPPARQQRGDAFNPDASPQAAGAPQPLGSPGSATRPVRQVGTAAVANPGQIIAGEENVIGRDPRQPTDLTNPQRNGQTASVPIAPGTAKGDIDLGKQQITNGDYEAAEGTFRQFIRSRPKDRLITEAVMGLGDSYFQRQRWREAAEQFVDMTTKYPKSGRAAEAELKLGISLRGLGATKEACDVLNNHGQKYPAASASIKQGRDPRTAARPLQRMTQPPRKQTFEPLTEADAGALFDPLFSDADGIVVAVSGGPDSMALLALIARWAKGRRVLAATVDHGLRAQSADEAAMVADFSGKLGVAHRILHWTGPKPSTGLQNAARVARYQLLTEHAAAEHCTHLVTAHHADDQAETVLMRLIAGSGVAGLAGMRSAVPRNGIRHVRPLLGISKNALVAYCDTRGIPSVSDPSNADERFGRARMRRLLPGLAAEGLTAERLSRLAGRAAQVDDALNTLAERALRRAGLSITDCVVRLDWRQLEAEPAELRLRVLGEVLRRSGSADGLLRLERLETLLEAIDQATASRARLRRSIGDRLVTLLTGGILTVSAAPARKRGRTESVAITKS